jgi:hypothetical protein
MKSKLQRAWHVFREVVCPPMPEFDFTLLAGQAMRMAQTSLAIQLHLERYETTGELDLEALGRDLNAVHNLLAPEPKPFNDDEFFRSCGVVPPDYGKEKA